MFSSVYTHFDRLLSYTYEIGMIYSFTDVFGYAVTGQFYIQNWPFFKEIFQENSYPENLIDDNSYP